MKLAKYRSLTVIISVSFMSTFRLITDIFMTNRHSIAIGIFTLDMPTIQTKRGERKKRDREGMEEKSHITLSYLRWLPPRASLMSRVKSEFLPSDG